MTWLWGRKQTLRGTSHIQWAIAIICILRPHTSWSPAHLVTFPRIKKAAIHYSEWFRMQQVSITFQINNSHFYILHSTYYILHIRLTDGGVVVSLTSRPFFTPGKTPGTPVRGSIDHRAIYCGWKDWKIQRHWEQNQRPSGINQLRYRVQLIDMECI
jgi:hypothetical protein